MRRSILAVAAGFGLLLAGPSGVAAQQRADSTASASAGSMHGYMHATMPAMPGAMTQCTALMGGAGMGTNMMGPAGGMGMNMGPSGAMATNMGPGIALDMMDNAMMPPQMLLRLSGTLDLTPQQTERLRTLAADSTASRELQEAAVARNRAVAALTGESPSIDDYNEALSEAADHVVAARTAMARAALDARAVLTPEQRSRLETGMRMMQGLMGSGMTGYGMMGSGMMGSGMMGSGMMGSGMPGYGMMGSGMSGSGTAGHAMGAMHGTSTGGGGSR